MSQGKYMIILLLSVACGTAIYEYGVRKLAHRFAPDIIEIDG